MPIRTPPMLPFAAVIALLATPAFVTASAAQGDAVAWKSVKCESARPYRGPALHRAPDLRAVVARQGPLDGSLPSNVVVHLESALKRALDASRAPSLSMSVGVPGWGLWSATRVRPGSDSTGIPPRWFWAASVGKAFTAVVVLQLVEEGKLRLSDPLSGWFPEFPNARAITLDHLLTHTGGTYSFQADPAFRARTGYQTPEELIAVAAGHGNGFCPGEYWSYSNTGYVLLGRIIEQVDRRPFHEVVQTRIVERLQLKNARALAPREEPVDLARPRPSDPGERQRETSLSTPFAAGAVISSAEDLVRFWHGLLSGALLKADTVQDQFQRLYPMFGGGTFYGRGVMLYEVPARGGAQTWLGHSGGAPGTKALVAYAVESGSFVAVLLNTDASAEAAALLLLTALEEVRPRPGSSPPAPNKTNALDPP